MADTITDSRAGARRFPRHVAVIMDGNGRWAEQRGLPRSAGHAAGAETFRRIATYCKDLGMDYLTVYAFSTENWKRSAEEVGAIMNLLKKYLLESIEKMERDRIRLKIIGDTSVLSPELRELIDTTDGRDEIVRAVKRFALSSPVSELTEDAMSASLDMGGIPDPDLIIRTGGEYRISNFLLWECAYSELLFSDVLWPDFSEKDVDAAVEDFARRDRRYGGVKK